MKAWTTACPDWERRIIARESLIPCDPLFPDQAAEGLRIFGELIAVDVTGSPKFGQISRKWVLDTVAAIFGAYDSDTGRRLIREVFLLISKKNGKSTDLAGIILTALLMNWRESGEMGILAPTIEVANNAWRPARDAIRADEELSDLLYVQDHIRTITDRRTKATLQVVAADAETVAGKKWIVTLVDELWLFGKKPNADKMLLEATGGMASRPEGFVMYCSTQSDDPPAGVFKQKLAYARDVRDGKIDDPEFLPIIYEFPPAMVASKAYRDEENWYITNPNIGASVDPSFIRRKIREAEHGSGDDSIQSVLAKHLNVEIGLNLRADRWTGADFWEAQTDPSLTLDTLLRRSEVVTVGIDGGGNKDLYGFTALGRERETGRMLSWSRVWALPILLERQKQIEPRLLDFQKQGDLVIVPRIEDACEQVVALIKRIDKAGLLGELNEGKRKAIGVDPSGIKQTLDALNDADYADDMIVSVSQGWRLSSSITSTELYLSSAVLWHAAQEVMSWAVGNAKIESRGNAVLITKEASGAGKIDPLMALFDAVELMAMAPEPTERKYQVMVF